VLHKKEVLNLVAANKNQITKQFYINQHDEELAPGNYNIALKFDNIGGKTLAVLRAQLHVKPFPNQRLSVSDLQLSSDIFEGGSKQQKLKPNSLLVVPYIGSTINKQRPLFIYFEIYYLTLSDNHHTKFRISYEVSSMSDLYRSSLSSAIQYLSRLVGKNQIQNSIGSSFESEGESEFQQIYLSIDFSRVANGPCQLTITITDLLSSESIQTEKRIILK